LFVWFSGSSPSCVSPQWVGISPTSESAKQTPACYRMRMTSRPEISIGPLRKIGFDLWDPIGGGVPEDEYDTYF